MVLDPTIGPPGGPWTVGGLEAIFKEMQRSSCSQYPFEDPVGMKIFAPPEKNNQSAGVNVDDLGEMTKEELQDLCEKYGISTKSKWKRKPYDHAKLVSKLTEIPLT